MHIFLYNALHIIGKTLVFNYPLPNVCTIDCLIPNRHFFEFALRFTARKYLYAIVQQAKQFERTSTEIVDKKSNCQTGCITSLGQARGLVRFATSSNNIHVANENIVPGAAKSVNRYFAPLSCVLPANVICLSTVATHQCASDAPAAVDKPSSPHSTA